MSLRAPSRGWRPSERQELVVRAAVASVAEAPSAWRRVLAVADIDALDGASHELLGLVYRKLAQSAAQPSELGRLKGVYRRTWYANHRLLHRLRDALEALGAAGVETMVLGGAPLTLLHYRDAGARPIFDAAIGVRPETLETALRALADAGWEGPAVSAPALLRTRLGAGLRDAGGEALELRWHALPFPSDEDDAWAAAVALEIEGAPTLAPAAGDALLQACAHGLGWEPAPRSFAWVADGLTILASSEEGIAWDRLTAQAIEKRATLPLGLALRYLRDTFGAPIPAGVVEALAATPSTRVERAAFRASLRGPTPLGVARVHRARRAALARVAPERSLGFAAYVQQLAGLERRSQAPLHAARRSVALGVRALRSR